MKELKLKAWVKSLHRIFQVDTIDMRSGTITYSFPTGINTPCYQGNYNLFEYTTINDKNNQEIYEGHIVKQQLVGGNGQDEIPIPDEIYYGVVIWDFCGWSIDSMGDGRAEIALINSAILEIMGHKFENPELLKV